MRTLIRFSTVLSSLLLVGLTNAPHPASASPIYAPLAASNTVFALNLYSQLAATTTGNIFFSPYSVSACLGMVYDGARGQTARQMAQALDFSTNQPQVGAEFGALLTELDAQQGLGGVDLTIANGLWAETNYPFLPAFLDNASNNFDASVQRVDFAADALSITDQINQWVADRTAGMITKLFTPGQLNAATVLALVDAIYFKAAWQSQFPTNATSVQPFYISPTHSVNVQLMCQSFTNSPLGYYQDAQLQAVELPYNNSNLTMVLLLPRNVYGLPQLEASLPQELPTVLQGLADFLTADAKGLQEMGVAVPIDVALPRFSMEMSANLIPPLRNLGMVDAFTTAADFSGINGFGGLLINVITHKAVIEVDESGAVAAAATGVGIISAVPGQFRADHPFILLICDTNSDSILFMGRVVDPTDTGGAPNLSHPLIQTTDADFGIEGGRFGFNVAATNATLLVEACTNLSAPAWFPVKTLTLSNGASFFSEPLASNAPSRFYRVRSP